MNEPIDYKLALSEALGLSKSQWRRRMVRNLKGDVVLFKRAIEMIQDLDAK